MFCMSLLFYVSPTYAIAPNLGTMLENLNATIPNLMQLITAIAYVLGYIMW